MQMVSLVSLFIAPWLVLPNIYETPEYYVGNMDMAVDSSQRPIVALEAEEDVWISDRFTVNPAVRVRRWNGSNWQNIGNFLESRRRYYATNPTVALSMADKIYVAFSQDDYDANLHETVVRTWSGSQWTSVGSPLYPETRGQSYYVRPHIAIDDNDNPIVAYQQPRTFNAGFRYDLVVKKFDGTNWVQLGSPLNVDNTEAASISIAINSAGNPIVAYSLSRLSTQNSQVRVFKWKANTWVEMGTGFPGNRPVVKIGTRGRPFLHHQDSTGLFVHEWRAGQWYQLGTPVNESRFSQSFTGGDLVVQGATNPVLAWKDGDAVRVSRYLRGQNKWGGIGTGTVGNAFGFETLEMVLSNGKFYVGFTERFQRLAVEFYKQP